MPKPPPGGDGVPEEPKPGIPEEPEAAPPGPPGGAAHAGKDGQMEEAGPQVIIRGVVAGGKASGRFESTCSMGISGMYRDRDPNLVGVHEIDDVGAFELSVAASAKRIWLGAYRDGNDNKRPDKGPLVGTVRIPSLWMTSSHRGQIDLRQGVGARSRLRRVMVGVVIPHHRRRDALARAVASAGDHPVVVVDDSEDGGLSLPGVEIRRTTGSEGFARAVNVGLTALESRGCSLALVLNDDAVLEEGALETRCAEWTEADGAIAPVLDEPHGLVYGIHVSRWGRVRLAMHPGPVQALSGAAFSTGPRNALMSNTDTGSRTSRAVVSPSADFGCASSSAPAVRMPLGQRSGARHGGDPRRAASTDTCATSGEVLQAWWRWGSPWLRCASRARESVCLERARPGRGGLPQGPSASERAFAVLMAGARPGSRRIR